MKYPKLMTDDELMRIDSSIDDRCNDMRDIDTLNETLTRVELLAMMYAIRNTDDIRNCAEEDAKISDLYRFTEGE